MCRSAIGMRRRTFLWFLVLVLAAVWSASAYADEGASIVRVEEDWELVVDVPEANSVSPQVTCVISPFGGIESVYAAFLLNAQTLPDFVAGGLQLQVWDGEAPQSDRKFPNAEVLTQAGETIRWTQSMEVVDGLLQFEITDGSSSTWGNFGGQGYLKATVNTTLHNLNYYSPDVSASNSKVSYADNRVVSLKLKKFRVFLSTGEYYEDTTERVVHQQD